MYILIEFLRFKEKSNKPPILTSCFVSDICKKAIILKEYTQAYLTAWKELKMLYCVCEHI